MLTNLSLDNFKSWRKIDGMRLAPITGLFGTNSSGKTSILQLLLMLRQTVESADRNTVLDLGGRGAIVDLGKFRDLIFDHDLSNPLQITLDWKLASPLTINDPKEESEKLFTGDHIQFKTDIAAQEGDRPHVTRMSYALDKRVFEMRQKPEETGKYELTAHGNGFKFIRGRGRPAELPGPLKCYGFPEQIFTNFQNASFLGDLQLAFEAKLGRMAYLGPLRKSPERDYRWSGADPFDMGRLGERVVDALLASRDRGKYISQGRGRSKKTLTLEERVAKWLQELGLIHRFSVTEISKASSLYEVRVKKSPSSAEVLITDVGFGVSQVLPVIALCYYVPEGSTILLEQPELHLHPSVQSRLADVFIDATKTRNVQIILESHSEHLLKRLQRRIAEEQIARDNVELYFCDSDGKESRLSRLQLNLFGQITNWPKDFFGDEFAEMAETTKAIMRRKQGGVA